jgi:hypothetical protein
LKVLDNTGLYTTSHDIINGTKWIYEKKYLGSPLLEDKYWPRADILYKGVLYKDVQMNYDVFNNDIIIFHPETGKEKYVVLSKDYLTGFSYTDTLKNKKHHYDYFEIPCIRGKALYETIAFNKTVLYIKPVKNIAIRSAKGQGEFVSYCAYYLQTEGVCSNFRSKNQLIKLLEKHSNELAKFIRKNKININTADPDNIVAVLRYFDELN